MDKGTFFSFATALSWSLAVICMRMVGDRVKPVPFNIFRNFVAVLCFITVLALGEGLTPPDFTLKEWVLLTLSGILGISIGDFLYLNSLNRLGAGLQAIVDCSYSPFVILFAWIAFGESLSPWGFFGAALVTIAVFVGSFDPQNRTRDRKVVIQGVLFGISAQFAMALTPILVRDMLREHSVLWMTGFRFFSGNVWVIAAGLFLGYTTQVKNIFIPAKTSRSVVFLMILAAILGSFLATYLWFMGFKHTSAGKVAVINQLSTLFIILLAAMILREKLTPRRIIAVILGFCGAVIVGSS